MAVNMFISPQFFSPMTAVNVWAFFEGFYLILNEVVVKLSLTLISHEIKNFNLLEFHSITIWFLKKCWCPISEFFPRLFVRAERHRLGRGARRRRRLPHPQRSSPSGKMTLTLFKASKSLNNINYIKDFLAFQ